MPYPILKMPHQAYTEEAPRIPQTGEIAVIKKCELNQRYGFLIWYNDYKYPVKGILLTPDLLMDVDVIKKFMKSIVKIFISFHPIKEFFKVLSELCRMRLYSYYHGFKTEYYDPFTREILRAGLIAFGDIRIDDSPTGENIIRGITHVLSTDRPYRYRGQDILQEVKSNRWPPFEVFRLLTLLQKRDHQRNWRGFRWLGMVYLLCSRKARKRVGIFFKELDIFHSVIYDESDLWHFLKNGTKEHYYAAMGMTFEKMQEVYKEIDEQKI